MKFPIKFLFTVVDVLFAVAEAVSKLADRKKKPEGLTMKDLLDLKRKDDELARKTQAPTVVIPAPSERERSKRR